MDGEKVIRILCASDIHLGRAPALDETPWFPLDERSAWDFVVGSALELEVDLLLLAGDVIESENQFFETRGPLKEGIRRLLARGIAIAAVAGNHDFEVFPGLYRDLALEGGLPAGFHLLQEGTGWKQETLQLAGGPLTVVGWSFPARHHPANPLAHFPELAATGPVLGLLHGDLSSADSRYGPLDGDDLDLRPVDRWVLGHIHAPTGAAGGKHFYCGSPLPLRSTERGAHGCWLLEYRDGVLTGPTLVPSPVRVDALEVRLDGSQTSLVEIQAAISEQVHAHVLQVQNGNPGLRTLFLDLRVTGQSPVPVLLEPLDFEPEYGGVQVRLLGPAEDQCLPALPMAEWAGEANVRGRLARMLLSLEEGRPDPEARRLLAEILRKERQSRSDPRFSVIDPSLWESAVDGEAWAEDRLKGSLRTLLGQIRKLEAGRG